MKLFRKIIIFCIIWLAALTACKTNGDNGTSGANEGTSSLFVNRSTMGPGAQCAAGGIQIDMGFDNNKNNILDPGEITKTEYVCNGTDASSHPFVVYTSPAASETGVPLNQVVNIVFNTEMDSNSVKAAGALTLKDENNSNVSGTVDYTGIVATFAATQPLSINKKYSINLSSAVTNIKGIALGYNQKTYFTTRGYVIGDTGPSGIGIVFYATDAGQHGLEAAPSLWHGGTGDPSSNWMDGPYTTLNGNTLPEVGTGLANSNFIIAQPGHIGSAAKLCRDYTGGGKTDWFLPSKDELALLFAQKDIVGGLTFLYWSSTEYDAVMVYTQYFDSPFTSITRFKSGPTFGVRPVRAF